MTSEGHFQVFRKMLIRIFIVIFVLGAVIFSFKKLTFGIILAPTHSDFCTFGMIEHWMQSLGFDFHFDEYHISLISTELSSQFMTHISVACMLAMLLSSPYIVLELFRYISPALYENEKKYSYIVAVIVYGLFILGVLMSYFIVFPISFQFLATYQVDESVVNTITLSSYISTFTTLTFLLGIVFQLPILAFVAGKMGLLDASMLKKYRAIAFVIILAIAAIITPPDIFTQIFVTIPIYGLYEVSILVLKKWGPKELPEEDVPVEEEE